jgi:hypothetical protein
MSTRRKKKPAAPGGVGRLPGDPGLLELLTDAREGLFALAGPQYRERRCFGLTPGAADCPCTGCKLLRAIRGLVADNARRAGP